MKTETQKLGWFARFRASLFEDPIERMKCDTVYKITESLERMIQIQNRRIEFLENKLAALLNARDEILGEGSDGNIPKTA